MNDKILIVIDGSYLNIITGKKFDYVSLIHKMARGIPILRCCYYDSLPYVSDPPTPEEISRYDYKKKQFAGIEFLPNIEVKLGEIIRYENEQDRNKDRYEQKGVDTMIVVDVMSMVLKRRISHLAIISGDRDFVPMVKAVRAEGIHVHLYHGARCHYDLQLSCDEKTNMFDIGFLPGVLRQQ